MGSRKWKTEAYEFVLGSISVFLFEKMRSYSWASNVCFPLVIGNNNEGLNDT